MSVENDRHLLRIVLETSYTLVPLFRYMRIKLYSILILFSLSSGLALSSCNKGMGCPGVKAYTESKQPKTKKDGTAPWTKKSKKKDKKKASSGIVPDKYAKKQK